MPDLGNLTKIADLRTIWIEERDFSDWLAKEENLAALSNEIGIDIDFEERESAVGGYKVDIFGVEEGSDRRIIIENQLEDTNHDHLGKIITYAAGKDAEIIIWIVKSVRDEHRQAVEWLNNHTDNRIGIFLIAMELWKIGDSLPAPKFNVIAKPNDWVKNINTGNQSEIQNLRLGFWNGFVEFVRNYPNFQNIKTTMRTPKPKRWFRVDIGNSDIHISLNMNSRTKEIKTGLSFGDNIELFNLFLSRKAEIEKELGSMEWLLPPRRCRMNLITAGDIADKTRWPEYYKWFADKLLQLREVVIKYYK